MESSCKNGSYVPSDVRLNSTGGKDGLEQYGKRQKWICLYTGRERAVSIVAIVES